jgi:hypothetical protein
MCNFGFHSVRDVRVAIVIPADGINPGQTNDHNVKALSLQDVSKRPFISRVKRSR